jgi:hypothetical protein
MNPGQLFIITTVWSAFHMRKNPHGIWVPNLVDENKFIISTTTFPENTPAMYIGTNGLPRVGIFLIEDTFYELPYNILQPIGD